MADGLIAEGVVDERSIEEVSVDDLHGFAQCHFFAGIGGWSHALRLAGWPDDEPVWTGSCPCQPFSIAGVKRGFTDERHLWPAWFRLITECRPVTVFGEQVENAIRHGWLDLVQADLERAGYAVGAAVFPAAGVGAPHIRDRLYFVADAYRFRHAPEVAEQGPGADGDGMVDGFWSDAEWFPCPDGKKRAVKPGIHPLVDGVPAQLGLLRGAGNAIVPQQAAAFVRVHLFPVPATMSAAMRKALYPSGAKDDPRDADLLLDLLWQHRDRLWQLKPDNEGTRRVQNLVEERRKLVEEKTAQVNRLIG
jgi:DNA (cytosine-5)-methyltransferase 1